MSQSRLETERKTNPIQAPRRRASGINAKHQRRKSSPVWGCNTWIQPNYLFTVISAKLAQQRSCNADAALPTIFAQSTKPQPGG